MVFSTSYRMLQPELKSLINEILNTMPSDVQMNLRDATRHLNDFLNDAVDFPHKCIPLKSFPMPVKDMFHRIANHNADDYGGYSHEQLITMDLAINPQRFDSWYTLLNIKIGQLNALLTDAHDLTK